MADDTVTLRPATPADAPAMAELIVQLYHAEVPGVLSGPSDGQLRLFRYLIEYELAHSARGRYLATSASGQIVGTASLRHAGEAGGSVLPPGIIGMAAQSLGWIDTLRMLGNLARASLLTETPLRPGEAYIYSVAVLEGLRGRGIGRQLMEQVEEQARKAGAYATLLRVIVGNQGARRLYTRLGYRTIGRTPVWADWLTFPTELMRKEL